MKKFRRVYLEISNICNLQCPFCPEVERGKKVMAPDFFRMALTAVAPHTEEVCLHLMGEPLGHPHFAAIVAICSDLNTPVNVTTNGLLIVGERRRLLLSPIVRQVNISVHSFQANFRGKDVGLYMERIFEFTRQAETERPDLYINYRLWDLGSADLAGEAENVDVRRAIEDEFGVSFEALDVNPRRKKGYRLRGRVYVNLDSRFEWPSMSRPVRGETGTCHGLSGHIGIHADGTVVPCCLDKEAVINLGNIGEQSLPEILGSPRARAMREGFERNVLTEDLCRRCTFIKRFDRKVNRGIEASPPAPER